MTVAECIETRRSIRRYRPDPIDHSLLESIVALASYSPSWKNTQITRYTAIEDPSLLKEIADRYTPEYNANIIRQAPVLIAVTFKKEDAALSGTAPFLRKRKTAGRCLTRARPARPSALPRKTRALARLSWGFLTKTAFQNCYIFQRSRNLAH